MKDIKESLAKESRILTNKYNSLVLELEELKRQQYEIITKYKTLTNEK